ncbi:twin-arginine translocation pathway signal [Sodiomyces alkalinus F11]|uniref:Twin-arginine translocation pathway signal n=1 Tax=Sodiomyces alkalinus (strain CBS 110278 / VKM F-3762 / F11) TaxID=1314773 RepID=A0A3N2Q8G8_SODAK|nr:twin-arginine translocation pathway signal [Sodiomyces alkalinus F11]ROT43071.1 twin-arginine translocation pathway signal [Sodiomyces alkalinus F11]
MTFSLKTALMASLAAVAYALPSGPKLDQDQMNLYKLAKRQNDRARQSGLTDIDILQFALTLEWLEGVFYQQGFARFPPEDFAALGLSPQEIADLRKVGETEFDHASFLQSAIAQAGFQPVQPCNYNFGFTDAAGMVATALVLESVGVSAYLGAASLVADAGILTAAGSILTVEARHQTFLRAATRQIAIPQPFDTPLGPRAVFSLAAPFFESCPEGSNLLVEPFPALAMADPAANPAAVAIGSVVRLQSEAAPQAVACGFTTGGLPGGTTFSPFDAATGGCEVPQHISGVVYVSLTSEAPLNGVLTDEITLAGPMVLTIS